MGMMNCLECPGHCCRAFPLSVSYGQMLRYYDAWCWGHKDVLLDGGGFGPHGQDVHIIALMIRPLGVFTENPITRRKFPKPQMLYRCVHFNQDTGQCEIYDRRPAMCRNYPYDAEECEYVQFLRAEEG